jgi:hypothetical protein
VSTFKVAALEPSAAHLLLLVGLTKDVVKDLIGHGDLHSPGGFRSIPRCADKQEQGPAPRKY